MTHERISNGRALVDATDTAIVERQARAEAQRRGRDEYWCGDIEAFVRGATWAATCALTEPETGQPPQPGASECVPLRRSGRAMSGTAERAVLAAACKPTLVKTMADGYDSLFMLDAEETADAVEAAGFTRQRALSAGALAAALAKEVGDALAPPYDEFWRDLADNVLALAAANPGA